MFSNSVFGDVLKLLPRDLVRASVARHGSDKWCKGFTTWDHLLSMLAAQYSGATSLRDVETVFNGPTHHHYHLATRSVRRSTLSDGNARRDPAVFREILVGLIARGGGTARRLSREAGMMLSVLDATTIRVTGRGATWAETLRTRHANQGLKLHIEQDAASGEPRYVAVSAATLNDVSQALDIPLEAGRSYTFDKGYCDYNWWHAIIEAGADFVTRIKRNAAFETIETRQLDPDTPHVIDDKVIRLTNKNPGGARRNKLAGHPLRLIRIPHPAGKTEPFLILASDLDAPAEAIARTYKDRWAIELLFKWLKQNLRIKRFLGETRNAITAQILIAMIAFILAKRYHAAKADAEIPRTKDMIVFLRVNLFSRPRTRHRTKQTGNEPAQTTLW